jgi:hypothetical protein
LAVKRPDTTESVACPDRIDMAEDVAILEAPRFGLANNGREITTRTEALNNVASYLLENAKHRLRSLGQPRSARLS